MLVKQGFCEKDQSPHVSSFNLVPSEQREDNAETSEKSAKGYVDIEFVAATGQETSDQSHFWITRGHSGHLIGMTVNGARGKKKFRSNEICVYDRSGTAYYCSSEYLCQCPAAPPCPYKGVNGTPDFKCLDPLGEKGCKPGKTRHDKVRKMVTSLYGISEEDIIEAAGFQDGNINDKSSSINGKKLKEDRCDNCLENDRPICSHLMSGRKVQIEELGEGHENLTMDESDAFANGRYFRHPPPKGWDRSIVRTTAGEVPENDAIKSNVYFEFVDDDRNKRFIMMKHSRVVKLLEENGVKNVRIGSINSRILNFPPPKGWEKEIKKDEYNMPEYIEGPDVYFDFMDENGKHQFITMNQKLAEALLKMKIVKAPVKWLKRPNKIPETDRTSAPLLNTSATGIEPDEKDEKSQEESSHLLMDLKVQDGAHDTQNQSHVMDDEKLASDGKRNKAPKSKSFLKF